jgi:phenylpyruvate tautomerase PptA (4-oxalocrotonate tautomerase family)
MPMITVAMYSRGTQKEKDRLTETITEDVARYWEYRRKC